MVLDQNLSYLQLSNFQGFGYESTDQLETYIYPAPDLSLFDSQLIQGGKMVQEARIVTAKDEIDNKLTKKFLFKEVTQKGVIEMDTPFDYKVIDFVSSYIITSYYAATNSKREKLYLFIGKSTKFVDLIFLGNEDCPYEGNMVSTQAWVIRYYNHDFLKFNIYEDKGFFFPVIVSISDDKQGLIQLRADKY